MSPSLLCPSQAGMSFVTALNKIRMKQTLTACKHLVCRVLCHRHIILTPPQRSSGWDLDLHSSQPEVVLGARPGLPTTGLQPRWLIC